MCKSFTDWGRAARTRLKYLQELQGLPLSTYQKWRARRIHAYEGAQVMLVRDVRVPRMTFWDDSDPSRRNSQVDPGR
eukprot:596156-Pyramimonas_sp.AAC.1